MTNSISCLILPRICRADAEQNGHDLGVKFFLDSCLVHNHANFKTEAYKMEGKWKMDSEL